MRKLFFVSIIFCQLNCFAQGNTLVTQYPKTISIKSDSFLLYYPTWKKPHTYKKIEYDTNDMGSDAIKGAYFLVIDGKDTSKVTYDNFPFAQKTFVPMELNGKKFVQQLRVNAVSAYFSREYIDKNKGKANFEIPEVFELANIIWTLSPRGQAANNLEKTSEYYLSVREYFKPYLTHPLFKSLDGNLGDYYIAYYDFRENSLAFGFEKDKIVRKEPYFYVMGSDWDNFTSLFQNLIPQIEDFARASKFREFYKKHLAYYSASIEKEKTMVPVRKMWDWMEKNFDNKYDSYKVVYSPLIWASHSTQNFTTFFPKGKGSFQETVMFVSGPESFEGRKTTTPKELEGLASGIVFTEIDHNYVNPLSYKFQRQIDTIFNKRLLWTGPNGDTDHYGTPFSVFNEYMTHAVFCLYIKETYDEQTAQAVIKNRVDLMVQRRKYIKFKEFNDKLLSLSAGRKVKDLYPEILEWAATIR